MVLAVLEARCGLGFGGRDVYLNVAGGLKISEPAADLAVAAALVSSHFDTPLPADGVVFGEIALIDNAARSACARARETSRFFALDREVFLELLSQTPPLLTQVLRGLSAKVRTANAKNRELQAQLA